MILHFMISADSIVTDDIVLFEGFFFFHTIFQNIYNKFLYNLNF